MPFKKITKQNLQRDSRVAGTRWNSVYGGYFSDKEVLDSFIRAGGKVWKSLPEEPEILYEASGTGLLGEHLVEYLKTLGLRPKLTIVDASKAQLDQNANPDTEKIHADILSMRLGRKFDVIIARSSLDYQPTPELQVRMLERTASHLKENGVFINQAASFSTREARDLADRIYNTTHQIGNRHFHWEGDFGELHEKAGLEKPVKIGEAPALRLTHEDHSARYGTTREDVGRIRKLITAVPSSKRSEIKATGKGYEINCRFPIYVTRLARVQ